MEENNFEMPSVYSAHLDIYDNIPIVEDVDKGIQAKTPPPVSLNMPPVPSFRKKKDIIPDPFELVERDADRRKSVYEKASINEYYNKLEDGSYELKKDNDITIHPKESSTISTLYPKVESNNYSTNDSKLYPMVESNNYSTNDSNKSIYQDQNIFIDLLFFFSFIIFLLLVIYFINKYLSKIINKNNLTSH
ncbi:Hypothetical transmembrane protein [Flavobacterium branchiophilum FL-15]|uniref:Hypothetical transmembrane protein n=1 Tax=Flavobacterium branchiophilum (strain FL-15) TaxID=1034807 RepID=G2Z0L1_FLABF|nr:hypothetical protein [Flavobacterium branchiophilum]CCB69410.1 Hypothetical transmembrane protein [Flavobacterium branchiophilum FL-15]